jgi:hypothetical protein
VLVRGVLRERDAAEDNTQSEFHTVSDLRYRNISATRMGVGGKQWTFLGIVDRSAQAESTTNLSLDLSILRSSERINVHNDPSGIKFCGRL